MPLGNAPGGQSGRADALDSPALAGVKAKWLLHDLYALAVESGIGEALPIRALVEAGTSLGFSDGAMRTAADRLVRQGELSVTRHGRPSVYALTTRGRLLVEDMQRRMASPYDDRWDGQWCIVGLSVPEHQRDVRDRMRIKLSWLGFGSPSTGFYLSPRDHFDEVRRLTEDLGAGAYVHMYRSEVVLPADLHDLVERAWASLEAVGQRYEEFVAAFSDGYGCTAECARSGELSGADAFRTLIVLENTYRKCLFDDPNLPGSLLPADWQGRAARDLYLRYLDLLMPLARTYFGEVYAAAMRRIQSADEASDRAARPASRRARR